MNSKLLFLLLVMQLIYTSNLNAADNRVLYFGDSHSVNVTLRTDLQKNLGHPVAFYASCGSNASHWTNGGYKSSCGNYNAERTTPLATLEQQHKPNKVVIELGDNMFAWKGSKPRRAEGVASNAKNDIEKLVASIDEKTPCYWVGPTWGSRGNSYFKSDEAVNEMYKLLTESIGSRCTIVDCRSSVPRDSKGDGLHHHNVAANTAWANCILENTKEPNLVTKTQKASDAPSLRQMENRQGLTRIQKQRLIDKQKFHENNPTGVGR